MEFYPSEQQEWTTKIVWEKLGKSVKAGEKVGVLQVIAEDQHVFQSADIHSFESTGFKKRSMKKYLIGIFCFLFFFSAIRIQRKRR